MTKEIPRIGKVQGERMSGVDLWLNENFKFPWNLQV